MVPSRPRSSKRRGRHLGTTMTSRVRARLGASPWSTAKVASVILLLSLCVALYFLSDSYTFFVYHADIEGNSVVSSDRIYSGCGAHQKSIFWISPVEIVERLQAHPYIQSARVTCRLPNSVTIRVEERVPQIVWATASEEQWVDMEGKLLPPLEGARPPILLVDDEALAGTSEGSMDQELARGILLVTSLMPSVTQLRYDGNWGLLFESPYGWKVALGRPDRMEDKVAALAGAQQDLLQHDEHPQLLDLRFPDVVYSR